MTNEELAVLGAAITGVTTLAGVVIGLHYSGKSTRQQIRASTVSTFRQEWINSLRDSIAGFQAATGLVSTGLRMELLSNEQKVDQLANAYLLRAKILLMINPNEPDHQELVRRIDHVLHGLSKSNAARTSPEGELQAAITEIAQPVLKREWKRVKSGE